MTHDRATPMNPLAMIAPITLAPIALAPIALAPTY